MADKDFIKRVYKIQVVTSIEDILNVNKTMFRGSILRHDRLLPDRKGNEGNKFWFKSDFLRGELDKYKESFVVYHKGVLCGQGTKKKQLYDAASSYYGSSNLAIFSVPEDGENLDSFIARTSLGEL